MKQSTIQALKDILYQGDLKTDEPMRLHTSFKTGGPADAFIMPRTDEQIIECIKVLRAEKEKYFIMGNGTNLLVSDAGYRGCVIQLFKNYGQVSVFGTNITAKAGAPLIKVCGEANKNSLSGLEFACGIPGTVGGAVTMNAGAYGSEMVKVVRIVRVYDLKYMMKCEYASSEMNFRYRHSLIKEEPLIVLEVEMELQKGDPETIQRRIDSIKSERAAKQPLDYPSAGSTFKRPEGHYAGKLIEDAGLKGHSIGGAMISDKHAGFIINKGNATSTDILKLMIETQKTVFNRFHVKLEPEICFLGWK
ncbi:MAG: UDP-N-acetylmuramate dehydrogenase [Lachnospiraceae bacterium]|nr:UDP-N-acetylmuramate dehydrogenase [Lachnospiraceae bacterium]